MNKKISPSKIQRLLKESNLFCNAGKLNEAKLIYQDLLKVVPSHPYMQDSLRSQFELLQDNSLQTL